MQTADALIDALHAASDGSGADGLKRFGIVTADKVIGLSVNAVRAIAKHNGRDHAVAQALWDSGWYEGKILACFLADPKQVTPAMMDRWAVGFDNWATCDTACFDLFDKTPHALDKVRVWARRDEEFVRRAAFALLASVALHAKKLPDAELVGFLPLIEAADDGRNFVKKGVSWALRSIGGKRAGLHAACIETAERMAMSSDPAKRWIGKDGLRDLNRPLVKRRLGL